MKKERIRRIPVNDMDIKAVERWLNDMAARGLFLSSTGSSWWRFYEDEPEEVRYRLEPVEERDGKLGNDNTMRRLQTAASYDDLLEAFS